MRPELRNKIITYNKSAAARKEKAEDLDAIVSALAQMLPSQLKQVLPDGVLAILAKHGVKPDG